MQEEGVGGSAYRPRGAPAGPPRCTFKIAAKKGLDSLGLENFGQGSERGVALGLNLVGVPYARTFGATTNCGALSSVLRFRYHEWLKRYTAHCCAPQPIPAPEVEV